MKFAVVTLFPEMLGAITGYGVTRRAVERGLIEVNSFNPRAYTSDKHQTVDGRPYGGGPGMVMMVEPLRLAVGAARQSLESCGDRSAGKSKVIYLSPQGRQLDQAGVKSLSLCKNLILIAGRYEGVDERFISGEVDEEWSIGDYVLSGGELPAMVLIDAVARQIPGVLGDDASASQDSFEYGLLDCPHYTRPEVHEGERVPSVLLSGDHSKIAQWRMEQSLIRTAERRPDLVEKLQLDDVQRQLLDEYQRGLGRNNKD